MDLIQQIEAYQPWNEQEARDKALILRCLREEPDVFTRENSLCHMTASAWVVNHDRTRVLMAYHNLYDSWAWLGGHADGETDPLQTALREVQEESGLTAIRPISPAIYSLEALTVNGHIKRGVYVSSHIHLNVTYLIEADEHAPLAHKPDENSRIAWFSLEDAVAASTELWFRSNIYSKLNAKLAAL